MVSSQSLSDSLRITVGLTKEHGGLSWFHFVCELDVIGWGEGGGQGGPTNTCSIDVFFVATSVQRNLVRKTLTCLCWDIKLSPPHK